jgi:5'-nucleotidase
MPYDLANVLSIGISSRALFDLEYENRIFDEKKLTAFIEYQRAHESDVLNPGTGFHLVESLLKLNRATDARKVEVMIFSRNHPDVYLRVSHSIEHHGLDITRAFLTGGEPLDRYLKAYKIDLFLSASDDDVKAALSHGIAAGRIYKPPTTSTSASPQIRIAFDGDCVLFSEEADLIGRADLAAFHRHEHENAAIPLPDGPFAKLIRTISQVQGPDPNSTPFRIGLVTARNAPSHERAIRTLRSWNVRIDNAAFLGGLPKAQWLLAFQPQIFFDGSGPHCPRAVSAH